MRKMLTIAVALVAMAAAFAAVAEGGTHSAGQHVRIVVTGTDPFTFALTPKSKGGIQRDTGPMTFCCWHSWNVTRAGTSIEVTNPLLTLTGALGTLKIRQRIEWVPLPDGWSVWSGTWKVVGGTGAYAGLSGHGREGGAWEPEANGPNRHIRIRLFGLLEPK